MREKFDEKSHQITQGYLSRCLKKDGSTKLDSFFGKKMLDTRFLETFSSKTKMEEELFTVDCQTGSKVAKQLTIGDCIRIGMNGFQSTIKKPDL